jgi:hypothetical protein
MFFGSWRAGVLHLMGWVNKLQVAFLSLEGEGLLGRRRLRGVRGFFVGHLHGGLGFSF